MEGGNQDIQKTVFGQLHSGETGQSFFKVFHDKINEAQLEIKATVSVNTSDIAQKANEDKDTTGKELEKAQKKRNAKLSNGVIITDELREELESAIISTQQGMEFQGLASKIEMYFRYKCFLKSSYENSKKMFL